MEIVCQQISGLTSSFPTLTTTLKIAVTLPLALHQKEHFQT